MVRMIMVDVVDYVFLTILFFSFLNIILSKKLRKIPLVMLSFAILIPATLIEALYILGFQLGWIGAFYLLFSAGVAVFLFLAIVFIFMLDFLSKKG